MVRIEPAELLCQHTSHEDGTALVQRRVDEPFWIDVTETSNALYREFLRDTGRPPPSWWRPAGVTDEEWDAKPLCRVRWDEALELAEWAGKRLPNVLEWQLAARGTDGRRYPWGDDRTLLSAHASFGHDDPDVQRFDQYLRFAEKVVSREDAKGPNGLLRALDNVTEWTETLQCFGAGQGVSYDFGRPVHIGGDYRDLEVNLHLGRMGGVSADSRHPAVGLRMAKSAR